MTDKILRQMPNLEIYNSKFTPNYGNWALGFCGDVYDKENPGVRNIHEDNSLQGITFLDLSNRGIHSLITKVRTSKIHFLSCSLDFGCSMFHFFVLS